MAERSWVHPPTKETIFVVESSFAPDFDATFYNIFFCAVFIWIKGMEQKEIVECSSLTASFACAVIFQCKGGL